MGLDEVVPDLLGAGLEVSGELPILRVPGDPGEGVGLASS